MVGPNKSTRRRKLQVALAHRRLANEFLDKLSGAQETFNACMVKLNADAPGALDTNYEATLEILGIFRPDQPALPAQNKSTLRRNMVAALRHRAVANELVDSLEEIQLAINALLAKLDAQAGTLTDTDFASTLSVQPVDADASLMPAQNKASVRTILRNALADKALADDILAAMSGLQESFNDALAQIDTGSITGDMDQFEVPVLDPDAV